MARLARVVGLRERRHQPAAESRERLDQWQEDDRGHDAEGGVEIHQQAGRGRIDVGQPVVYRHQERQHGRTDDGARDQVAERHAARLDVDTRLVEVRGHRAADIGADHQ